jgi:hypothetical protein
MPAVAGQFTAGADAGLLQNVSPAASADLIRSCGRDVSLPTALERRAREAISRSTPPVLVEEAFARIRQHSVICLFGPRRLCFRQNKQIWRQKP